MNSTVNTFITLKKCYGDGQEEEEEEEERITDLHWQILLLCQGELWEVKSGCQICTTEEAQGEKLT